MGGIFLTLVVSTVKQNNGDDRVALTPDVCANLVKNDLTVLIEKGSGVAADFMDSEYEEAGAKLVDHKEAVTKADILTVVSLPDDKTLGLLSEAQVLLGLINPIVQHEKIKKLADQKVTALAFELLPRTVSRSQTMDALSSQSSVAGYEAVLDAAAHFKRYLPMMITAAGTAKPANVLVLGAGVAGLQAIGTAKRLGAVVTGYDVRPDSKGEVESLGAKFLTSSVTAATKGGYARELTSAEHQKQQDELINYIGQNDIIITTAQVPGRKPPLLVPEKAVSAAKAGTVFVDLAASDLGGNVAGSKPKEVVETETHVRIIGASDLPSRLASSSSSMYAKNVQAVIKALVKDSKVALDVKDDVFGQLTATYQGQIVSDRLKKALGQSEKKEAQV